MCVVPVVNNPPANARKVREVGLIPGVGKIPGSGRSPGEGNGNPFQYSCLEDPMDRWTEEGATVHGLQSRT